MSEETRQKLAEVLRTRADQERRPMSTNAIGSVKDAAAEVADQIGKRAAQTVEKFRKAGSNVMGAFDVADQHADAIDRAGAELQAHFAQLSNFGPSEEQ